MKKWDGFVIYGTQLDLCKANMVFVIGMVIFKINKKSNIDWFGSESYLKEETLPDLEMMKMEIR